MKTFRAGDKVVNRRTGKTYEVRDQYTDGRVLLVNAVSQDGRGRWFTAKPESLDKVPDHA